MTWYQIKSNEIVIAVKVKPNAKQTKILQVKEGYLNIAIHAPAIDGAANKALLDFLAQECKTPKTSIVIMKGTNGRLKLLKLPYNQTTANWVQHIREIL